MKKKTWYLDRESKKDNHSGARNTRKPQKVHKGGNKNKVSKPPARTTTVLFVPSTRGGILARKLREEEVMSEITGFKIRFQEAGGTQLRNKFNTDLGRGKHCGRKDCHPCDVDGDSRQNCRNINIVYESTCLLCNPPECSDQKEEKVGSSSESTSQEEVSKVKQAKTGVYIGETSRSLYERSKEHITDAKNYSHKSHMKSIGCCHTRRRMRFHPCPLRSREHTGIVFHDSWVWL